MLFSIELRSREKKRFSKPVSAKNMKDVCAVIPTVIENLESKGYKITYINVAVVEQYELFSKLQQQGQDKRTIRDSLHLSEVEYQKFLNYYRAIVPDLTRSLYEKEKTKGLNDYQISLKYNVPEEELEFFKENNIV